MKQKNKIIIINICIVVLSLVLFGQVAFLFLKSNLTVEKLTKSEIEATNRIETIKKTGYLDIIGKGSTISLADQIFINTEEEFVNTFNGYYEKLKGFGGYTLKSSGMVSGTASVMGSQITAYQATESIFEVDQNGDVFTESLTAEVPSSSGETTGYGAFTGKRIWVTENSQQVQETANVSYKKNGNEYLLFADYSNSQIIEQKKDREFSLLPFVVSLDTIKSFSIKENAMSYDITIFLKGDGYKQIATDAWAQSGAVKMPEFKTFRLDITMDKWGNVVSMNLYQNYIITVNRIGFNIDSETISSSYYILKKKEIENI